MAPSIAGAAGANPPPPAYAAAACDWLDTMQLWLKDPPTDDPPPCERALDFWLGTCSPVEVSSPSEPSLFHTVALGLCAVLSRHPRALCTTPFDETAAFGSLKDLLLIHTKPISEMSWTELGDTISALQMEFRNLIVFSADTGLDPLVDLDDILIAVMRRIGFWALHRVSLAQDTPEAVRSSYDADEGEHSRLHLPVIFDTLDAVHSMWSAFVTLTGATLVKPRQTPAEIIDGTPLFNHHREASIDDFYELSMVADLGPGAIIQYKNKFRYLFHSISQVIYFHYPAYERQIQKPLHDIRCYGAPPCSLLPLMRQIDPDIPVRYEHTGAGHLPTLAEAPWQWVLVGGFIVLVAADGTAFCAEDLRTLYTHTAASQASPGVASSPASPNK